MPRYKNILFQKKLELKHLSVQHHDKTSPQPSLYSRTVSFVKRFHVADVLFIAVLITLCAYGWHLLPQAVIRSDGYVHMMSYSAQQFWGLKYPFTTIAAAANIVGPILGKFFGPNMSYYLWFELVIILVIDVLFYLLIRVVTNKSSIAFAATLVFGMNFFANWNMYGTHCYCFYLERVLNLTIVIPSFIFLHLFLISNKKRWYVLSLITYLIGMDLGQVGILLTPLFVFYPFFWFLLRKSKSGFWQGIFWGMWFGLISLLLITLKNIYEAGLAPSWGFFEFFLNPQKYHYFSASGNQLVFWSQYLPVLKDLFTSDPARDITVLDASQSFWYYLVFYVLCATILIKRLPQYRALLITALTASTVMFFLNSYLKLNEIIPSGANRYLYFPNFPLSIFWGIALWYFFLNKRNIWFVVGIMLLIVYYYLNLALLENIFYQTFVWGNSTKSIITYVLKTRDSLLPNTLVVGQYPEFGPQEGGFFTEFLGRGEVKYLTEDTDYYDWKTQVPNYKYVIKLTYSPSCHCTVATKIK